jgi:hypothetical protein
VSAPSVPVPLRAMDNASFVVLELIVTLPETVPVASGAKVTEKFAVPPAAIVWPAPIPPELKPEPVVATCEMLTVVVPELVTLTVCVAVLPTATFPKLRLLAVDERTPVLGFAV